ncbi:helix-turn-helix domain-containing protein [Radicibacter daui]|uniref:helix-turn-helix domain-containing protein n=1 Tax=Radicibacter daui TaxID=3064829 RepID=UPI004046F009
MNKQVGADIRALRKARGMTLKDVADVVGRSTGWLSQIERGNAAPSVHDLGRIAEHFGITISFFFRSSSRRPEEQGIILRAADRMPIGSHETGLVEELLSPTLSGGFEMIKSVFAPHSDSGGMMAIRPKEDGGVLISGTLKMTIGSLEVALQPGDSFQFSGTEYSWRNDGDEPAVVIWVVCPPVY